MVMAERITCFWPTTLSNASCVKMSLSKWGTWASQ